MTLNDMISSDSASNIALMINSSFDFNDITPSSRSSEYYSITNESQLSITKMNNQTTIGGYFTNNNSSDLFINDFSSSLYSEHEMLCRNIDFQTNMTYLNVSCETNLNYSTPLYGYLTPILLLTTVIANTLIVLVLNRRNMASPTNSVLMAMALCDMFTLLFPAPGLLYMFTFGNHFKPLAPTFACYAFNTFNEVVPAMFHTASIWLTLALAIQRYIYVCHAPVARTWCTMPRVKKCILYICIAAMVHQSTKFFDRSYELIEIEINNENASVCHVTTADWVDEYVGINLYFTTYYLFRVLFVHLIPCILLVILNLLLFKAMKEAQDRRKILLFRENKKKECKKIRDANCTTLMLIVVVTVFLIVEIPMAIITALHIISSAIIEFLDYRLANLFILFANFFIMVSYPINFAIYCGMSRQFRETFKDIFIKRFQRGNSGGNGGGGGSGSGGGRGGSNGGCINRDSKRDFGGSSKYSLVNGVRTTVTTETAL